jgi:hypothetical protein
LHQRPLTQSELLLQLPPLATLPAFATFRLTQNAMQKNIPIKSADEKNFLFIFILILVIDIPKI